MFVDVMFFFGNRLLRVVDREANARHQSFCFTNWNKQVSEQYEHRSELPSSFPATSQAATTRVSIRSSLIKRNGPEKQMCLKNYRFSYFDQYHAIRNALCAVTLTNVFSMSS